ncbi:hypothetical protein DBT_0364 [Dissulfuribacter thermophilus]|uniref:Uncharacterized protein n=1 Tax=Dissulfuribacter thermophilus TaxID=1156395 RepID=A0A1B9F9F0_9BACT|nr:hypothetical protein [Dissulfuribacter thermophilus]OCC16547.1 hypothetical protein DBT_0364 [Dissulfuribacter thermophilus]
MIDVNLNDLLREYRSNPYEEFKVETPHTGIISFKVKEGLKVKGPSGQWNERPGTTLFTLERERNVKSVQAERDGEVSYVNYDLEGCFCEARVHVLTIRHKLSKDEIINKILKKVLYIFEAPETARYYLVPELESIREQKKEITLRPGDEFLIMSLMKRDTFIKYEGPKGIIFRFYFKSGDIVEQGEPLFGIASPEDLEVVQKIIQRIQTEWDE